MWQTYKGDIHEKTRSNILKRMEKVSCCTPTTPLYYNCCFSMHLDYEGYVIALFLILYKIDNECGYIDAVSSAFR
jgi:hypothetical protein